MTLATYSDIEYLAQTLASLLLEDRHKPLATTHHIQVLQAAAHALSNLTQDDAQHALRTHAPMPRLLKLLTHTDERLVDAVATLVAIASGHGAHVQLFHLEAGFAIKLRTRSSNGGCGDADGTGSRVWRASRAAAARCASGFVQPGQRVVELGCGCGLVGVACGLLGASEVILCDSDEDTLKLARENAALNDTPAVVTRRFDWGDTTSQSPVAERVIACDCVYDVGMSSPLVRAVLRALERGEDARALVILDQDEKRSIAAKEEVSLFAVELEKQHELAWSREPVRGGESDDLHVYVVSRREPSPPRRGVRTAGADNIV